MTIGFQGWYLTQPYTGIGQHSLGLLKALAKKKTKCMVAVPEKVRIEGVPNSWVTVIKPKAWLLHPSLKKWYWERIQVPQFFATANPDWEYYPYPSPLPRYSANLRAMTVHDTILWNDERYFGGPLKSLYHHKTRLATVDVDHVFGVSQSTLDALGLPHATLLYNGLPEVPKGLKKYSYENALVYLGGYDIRKKVPELITAFNQLRDSYPEMKLLLIGKAHHESRYYPNVPIADNVEWLGSLNDKELYSTLKSAFAFVHFSDSEGFNIPLLQAMASGTPALINDLPVNREISDGAALFLDSEKSDTLVAGVKALKRKAKRESVIKKQKAAARRFNWTKTASTFIKTLNKVSQV